ncbi:gamma-glutamyltransferase family protein [uncultured Bradyrhizobium sp.]|uniref:gamma-glutamyltransferase family protein n=1 Tax=uncultured Bradyrhizobium sp. TaxID=199684 RepID=UPI0035CA9A25
MNLNTLSGRNEIAGTFGVVASSHWIASQAGMAMLERGGNAFDAVVAAGFVMQVAEPHQNGLGGDAVMLIRTTGDAVPRVVCGQGVVPAAATIDRYGSLGLKLIPAKGLLAAVVPGAFDAWMLILRDYGTRPIEEVLSFAIGYASNGIPLTREASREIAKSKAKFTEEWTSSGAIYLSKGEVPAAGSLIRNEALAQTYARLLEAALRAGNDRCEQIEAARHAFYRGYVADEIGQFFARPDDAAGHTMSSPGFLTAQDLFDWSATFEQPVSYVFEGVEVFKPGGWSQGPAFLQFLALFKHLDYRGLDPFGAELVHIMVEALKLAYADREAWYGEAREGYAPPIPELLSERYNADRARLIIGDCSRALRPGSPCGYLPCMPEVRENVSGGASAEVVASDYSSRAKGDTCHIDVIDRWGNMVAATPSGGWLHGSPAIPALGFSISTRAQMAWLQPGLPSSLKPKTRPRTSLSPTMAIDRSDASLAFGSRGGDYQDQWALQFFLRHMSFGFDLQQAADAPMFHSDHWARSDYPRDACPAKLTMDERFAENVVSELKARGHDVYIYPGRRWGRNCAARKDGVLLRAAASASVPQALAVGR